MLKKIIVPLLNRIPNAEYLVEYLQGKKPLGTMNPWQEGFCEWNAERLGISTEQSIERYRRSWNALRSGHRGRLFRYYAVVTHDVFGVFSDDSPREIFRSYQYFSHLDFLRFLSYRESPWADQDPVVQHLLTKQKPVILDFGCGLAHRSVMLAKKMLEHGKNPLLLLSDIPTIRKEFLTWFCAKQNIEMRFIDCTEEKPIPSFPAVDCCIATEVFEHLLDPVPYFRAIDTALSPGGYLLTHVGDHRKELFHVSPELGRLRDELANRLYEEIAPFTLFRKPTAFHGS